MTLQWHFQLLMLQICRTNLNLLVFNVPGGKSLCLFGPYAIMKANTTLLDGAFVFISLHRLLTLGLNVNFLTWVSEQFLCQNYMATLTYISEVTGVMKSVCVYLHNSK